MQKKLLTRFNIIYDKKHKTKLSTKWVQREHHTKDKAAGYHHSHATQYWKYSPQQLGKTSKRHPDMKGRSKTTSICR